MVLQLAALGIHLPMISLIFQEGRGVNSEQASLCLGERDKLSRRVDFKVVMQGKGGKESRFMQQE